MHKQDSLPSRQRWHHVPAKAGKAGSLLLLIWQMTHLPIIAGRCQGWVASHGCCCQHVTVRPSRGPQQRALAFAIVSIPRHLQEHNSLASSIGRLASTLNPQAACIFTGVESRTMTGTPAEAAIPAVVQPDDQPKLGPTKDMCSTVVHSQSLQQAGQSFTAMCLLCFLYRSGAPPPTTQ